MILVAHMIFPAPLHLTEDEARAMAVAMLNVQREFGFEMSPKAKALLALGGVSLAIYRPKMMALAAAVRQKRAEQQAAADPTHFTGEPAQPWQRPRTNGQVEPLTAAGGEIIIPTGAPDSGKIDFGSQGPGGIKLN